MKVDRSAGIPLYIQVRDASREEILDLAPGTMSPTESELEARFGVSRITHSQSCGRSRGRRAGQPAARAGKFRPKA